MSPPHGKKKTKAPGLCLNRDVAFTVDMKLDVPLSLPGCIGSHARIPASILQLGASDVQNAARRLDLIESRENSSKVVPHIQPPWPRQTMAFTGLIAN